MKTATTTILAALFAFFMIDSVYAQERTTDRVWQSPNAAVSQTIGLTEVSVTYGRPGVRDRLIFGDLVPYSEVWRTGANESTAITFSDAVRFEGEHLEAGVYSMYTIPEEDAWTIIINERLSWGTEYDSDHDVLRVEVDAEESHFMEQMMIYFEDVDEHEGTLVIHWADTKVPVTIEPVTD